jgi:aminoglycoside phosphotransferase (APT) family kinase protein
MHTFSHNTLARLVTRHLPDVDGNISFERIATGKFNTSFYVRANGAEWVLRIAPPRDAIFVFYERDMMRQEPEIHTLLRARTNVAVAEVLAFDDTHELIDRDYMLMQRLPGHALTGMGGVNYDGVLRQVGRQLSQVHALTADRYGYLGAHRPMQPQTTWVAAFEIMWNKLIDDIASVGHYNADESSLMRQLLDRHLKLFDRPVPASLLHMDIWHQNILVDGDGRVTGLVDWDRALWGDPEIEFAVLDYCGISEPAFWNGYGRARDESREAEIRRVFYLLYELQKYIVIEQGRAHRPAGARRYKQQVMDIVQSLTSA